MSFKHHEKIYIKSINIFYIITKNKINLKKIKLVKLFIVYIINLIYNIRKLFETINEYIQKKNVFSIFYGKVSRFIFIKTQKLLKNIIKKF